MISSLAMRENFLDSYNLVDLRAMGSSFTWARHVQGNKLVLKRLDRALACFD